MKRALFIGNREGVFRQLDGLPELELVGIYALHESYLEKGLLAAQRPYRKFETSEKKKVLEEIDATQFDILIANGCPLVLPISKLRKDGRLFLNVHASYLPDGRGMHPINGAILAGSPFIGATLHYMDDGVDTGHIIHQERMSITDDLDLGLMYWLGFELEAQVFGAGVRRLIDSGFTFPGTPQPAGGFYYSRRAGDQIIDLAAMPDAEILRHIRAYGIRSQGAEAQIEGRQVTIYDAERITNPYLLARFREAAPGSVLLRYQDRLLVRTKEGILKITSHS